MRLHGDGGQQMGETSEIASVVFAAAAFAVTGWAVLRVMAGRNK
jgi:hypothetical protein